MKKIDAKYILVMGIKHKKDIKHNEHRKHRLYQRYKEAYTRFRNDDYRIVVLGKKEYRVPSYICGYEQTYKYLEFKEKNDKT